ncbi:MAG: hypothetical protein J5U17_08670 [Candidatus Methanoperedens sp.]|nr:hypothetical protein [Candidatus Methanoperedens sp.]MCE8429183.1 hypothetical protein [Candidatus Methanoperedens sp.]
MLSYRIRELEEEIETLEKKQKDCTYRSTEWQILENQIEEKKNEIAKLKRREREAEEVTHRISSSSMFGMGGFGFHTGSGGFGGKF